MPVPRSKRETLQNPRARGGKDKHMRENVASGFDATTGGGNDPTANARSTTSEKMESAHMEHGDGKPSGVVGDKMKPAHMGGGDGKPSGVAYKAEEEEEDEDYDPSENEDDEDDSDDEGKKSMAYDSYDLVKALDDFELVEESLVEATSAYDREGFLLNKLYDGTISKSERAELGEIMMKSDQDDDDGEPIEDWQADDILKSVGSHIEDVDPDHAELLDASPFLGSLAKALDASLGTLREVVVDDGRTTRAALQATGTLLKATARHQIELVDMIKSLQDQLDDANQRLGIVEETPVLPRSVVSDRGMDRGIAKSAIGGQPAPIQRSDLFKALNAMTIEAADRNDAQALDQLTKAVALVEAGANLPPNLHGAVVQRLNQGV